MIVKKSRYIQKKYFFDENRYAENMLALLLQIGKQQQEKSVLFPVSDQDMIIVSQFRNQLENYYHLLMPPHETLEMLLNKDRFAKFAQESGLPMPQTFCLSEVAAVDEIAKNVNYPCIVKPSWRDDRWLEKFRNTKVLIVHSPADLRTVYSQLSKLGQKAIVQEIVPGEEYNILCSFTFLNRDSEMLGMFVCRKLRQFPANFGNTSLAESVNEPMIVELTRDICRRLDMVGYISIEFKKDERSGAYIIIEITPCRLNRQSGLAAAAGFDIPDVWYRCVANKPVETRDTWTTGIKWLSEVNEIRTMSTYVKEHKCSLYQLARSYAGVSVFEIYSRDDMKPLLYLLPAAARYWLARYRHGRLSLPGFI